MNDPVVLLQEVSRLLETAVQGRMWLTASEAADFLRYDKTTFDKLAASGAIPRHKRGAGYRYCAPALTEWLLLG